MIIDHHDHDHDDQDDDDYHDHLMMTKVMMMTMTTRRGKEIKEKVQLPISDHFAWMDR